MNKYQELFLGIGASIVSCTEDGPRCSRPASVHLVLVHLDNARQVSHAASYFHFDVVREPTVLVR